MGSQDTMVSSSDSESENSDAGINTAIRYMIFLWDMKILENLQSLFLIFVFYYDINNLYMFVFSQFVLILL